MFAHRLYPTLLLLCLLAASARAEGPVEVSASAELQKRLTSLVLQPQSNSESLRLSARIELDQLRVARIGSSVTGRITEIEAHLGQAVKKGQRLALLNSTELGQAQSDYLKASAQVNLRRLAVQRAERLLQSEVIAAAELQERQGVLTEAEVDMRAAHDRLRVMGMQESDLNRLTRERNIYSFSAVTASIDGVVIERNVAIGQVVQPADSLYTVADLSNLWLVAEIPEQQAQWARTGMDVTAEIPALPGVDVRGKLIYVSDLVNPDTRTVTVRMALANPERLFKPQMLATLNIKKAQIDALFVPSQAVIREENRDYVFVQKAPGRYELRPVQLAREENGKRQVVKGLQAGEVIVTDGAFHLNNDRNHSSQE